MSRSPRWITPMVGSSRPATIRRVVVLPHPDGPSRAKKDPAGTSRSSESTALKAPKSLVRSRISRPAAACPSEGADVSASTRCDIGPVPFVGDLLLVVEGHEAPGVGQHVVGGEDQRALGGRTVELEHLLLGPLDGADVEVPVGELGRDLGLVVVVDP